MENEISPEGMLYFFLGQLKADFEKIMSIPSLDGETLSLVKNMKEKMDKCERIIYGYGSGAEEICGDQEQEKCECV